MQQWQWINGSMDNSIWHNLSSFWSFQDANLLWVLMGTIILGISASMVGAFAFLRKRSLMGDALAHSALPGIMTAFILFQTKNPLILFVGATFASFAGYFLMDVLPKKTKIKPDAAMAITLSFFFALGLMELSYIQGLETANKSGLDKILFGQAAAMTQEDVNLLMGVASVVIVTLILFFQKFRLIAFHRLYAQTLGVPVRFYELLLALLIVMSVVIGLQIVGVVLMAAVLLIPVAAARYWSDSLAVILGIAALIGAMAGLISSQISYVAPSMPTGPWMVLSLTLLFFISLLVSPKGVLRHWITQRRLARRVVDENILRTLYKISERKSCHCASENDILSARSISLSALQQALQRLQKRHWILFKADEIHLTQDGFQVAQDLTRKHRLWENYLSEHTQVTDKTMHRHAEEMEHLMTEEEAQMIEQEIVSKLDPHGNPIPPAVTAVKGGRS